MGLSVGIVGLPNVGKSTLFNALTAAGAQAANYPFCTIDPNVGIVPVPDPRLKRIEKFIGTQRIIPAAVQIVDIAGLVRGASKGEGLGNQFLAHIRETDAILSVARCFEDPNIVHVDGSVDPLRDIDVIQMELIYADLESVEKREKRAAVSAKSGSTEAKVELALAQRLRDHLGRGLPARSLPVDGDDQKAVLRTMHLLTSKPVLYCCNVAESDLASGGNEMTDKVRKRAEEEGARAVVVCGKIEEELVGLDPESRAELLAAYGLKEPALDQLIRACYELLGLQSYFTAGEKEIRAWTIHRGDTAPQAAAVIHTDFEKGFIRANVYTLEDLEKYHTETEIRAHGRLRSEGRDYVVQDGDIMHFLFNV